MNRGHFITCIVLYLMIGVFAYGSGSSDEIHVNWFNFTFTIFNFILFVLLLFFLLRKPVKRFFKDRAAEISGNIEKAEKEHASVKENLDDYEKRLANLDKEIAGIKKDVLNQAEIGSNKLLEEADILKKRILDDAEKMKKHEIEKVNIRFKKEVFKLAKELAEKMIKENISEEDHKKLQKEFLEK